MEFNTFSQRIDYVNKQRESQLIDPQQDPFNLNQDLDENKLIQLKKMEEPMAYNDLQQLIKIPVTRDEKSSSKHLNSDTALGNQHSQSHHHQQSEQLTTGSNLNIQQQQMADQNLLYTAMRKRLKLNAQTRDVKFQNNMKVFQSLPTFIDVKSYIEKMNIQNNKRLMDAIKQKKQNDKNKTGQFVPMEEYITQDKFFQPKVGLLQQASQMIYKAKYKKDIQEVIGENQLEDLRLNLFQKKINETETDENFFYDTVGDFAFRNQAYSTLPNEHNDIDIDLIDSNQELIQALLQRQELYDSKLKAENLKSIQQEMEQAHIQYDSLNSIDKLAEDQGKMATNFKFRSNEINKTISKLTSAMFKTKWGNSKIQHNIKSNNEQMKIINQFSPISKKKIPTLREISESDFEKNQTEPSIDITKRATMTDLNRNKASIVSSPQIQWRYQQQKSIVSIKDIDEGNKTSPNIKKKTNFTSKISDNFNKTMVAPIKQSQSVGRFSQMIAQIHQTQESESEIPSQMKQNQRLNETTTSGNRVPTQTSENTAQTLTSKERKLMTTTSTLFSEKVHYSLEEKYFITKIGNFIQGLADKRNELKVYQLKSNSKPLHLDKAIEDLEQFKNTEFDRFLPPVVTSIKEFTKTDRDSKNSNNTNMRMKNIRIILNQALGK